MDTFHVTRRQTIIGIPLCLRLNNPGSIELSPNFTWKGQLNSFSKNDPTSGKFCRFDTALNGRRALLKLLLSYATKDNCKTIWAIITRFAPAIENDVAAYISDVLEYINKNLPIEQTQIIATSPYIFSGVSIGSIQRHVLLAQAITHHEQGEQPYSQKEWEDSYTAL